MAVHAVLRKAGLHGRPRDMTQKATNHSCQDDMACPRTHKLNTWCRRTLQQLAQLRWLQEYIASLSPCLEAVKIGLAQTAESGRDGAFSGVSVLPLFST